MENRAGGAGPKVAVFAFGGHKAGRRKQDPSPEGSFMLVHLDWATGGRVLERGKEGPNFSN